jgi:hypothetical protein
MNKFKQDKNIYPRADQARTVAIRRNRFNKKTQKTPEESILLNKKIAMSNMYASLVKISEELNVPIVGKTFGKGIIRVSCRTTLQLDNIAPILKEMVKLHLMEEIAMEPLPYSQQMNNLVLFIKPTDILSSQKIDYVFQKYSLTSFGYQHLVIDIEYPVAKKGGFKSKRNAVKNAYCSLRQMLKQFNIPCVNETFGEGIIRVCCRTVVQLDHITVIMTEFLKAHLIEEVKMPLKYSYKMRSLVLFLKPANILKSSMKLDYVFQKSSFQYHHLVIDIEPPEYPTFGAAAAASAAASKTVKKKTVSLKSINNVIKSDHKNMKQTPMDNVSKIIIAVTVISILLTAALSTRT